MKHGFSLTSPLYHVIITNRVNKAFMKGYTTAGVLLCELFFRRKILPSSKGTWILLRKIKGGCMEINGKHTKLPEGTTILDYLEQNHYVLAQIAVEHNYVILDKEDYAKVVLKDDDILEIVSFMGGGC